MGTLPAFTIRLRIIPRQNGCAGGYERISVHLETHAVVDLVVRECDVILIDRVPSGGINHVSSHKRTDSMDGRTIS